MNASYDDRILQDMKLGIEKHEEPSPKDRELAVNFSYHWVERQKEGKSIWVAEQKHRSIKDVVKERLDIQNEAMKLIKIYYNENNPKICYHTNGVDGKCIWEGCDRDLCSDCQQDQRCMFHHHNKMICNKVTVVGYPKNIPEIWGDLVELTNKGYKNIWALEKEEEKIV